MKNKINALLQLFCRKVLLKGLLKIQTTHLRYRNLLNQLSLLER